MSIDRRTDAPLIGVSGRRLAGTALEMESRYQLRSFNMYFSDYSRALAEAGAVPVQIPYDVDPRDLMGHLDGMVITGGQDVDPAWWGGDQADVRGVTDPARDSYEADLAHAALAADVPLLAICRGMQLVNVCRGGSLVGDLDQDPIDHRGEGHEVDALIHTVETTEDSLARLIYGQAVEVNSLHHQAVDYLGEELLATGRSPDGGVEIIELPGHRFLGVQWHPEWMPHPDPAFGWLVAQARVPRSSIDQP